MHVEIDTDGDLVLARRPARNSPPPLPQRPAREEELVLSEVHMESLQPAAGCSTATTFTDAGGQPVVAVQHSMATPLRSVGLQVWRGALLLADLLLHRGAAAFGGATALELGAGSGLAGLVLSRFASGVYLTDTGAEVLANCQANADRHLQQHRQHKPPGRSNTADAVAAAAAASEQASPPRVLVRQLDWLHPPDWLLEGSAALGRDSSSGSGSSGGGAQHSMQQELQRLGTAGMDRFAWQPEDAAALQQLDYLLAADSVYDDVLTEAFMRSAVLLMRYARRHSGRSPRLLVGLERRICFTMTDQAVRAPAYDYWRTLFEAVDGPVEGSLPAGSRAAVAAELEEAAPGAAAAAAPSPGRSGTVAQQGGSTQQAAFPLVGWRIDLASVPQALHPFERGEYLELWELELKA
ncbi:methyltransferase 22 isoform X2 [Chlorella sorokiniana]|uniref:Methyltransferase 22 isoform X2 n=1 Tax=Chlorella sorokiniana TaxID=3076 RepID=A0A2P6TWB0_CHLSO|nr:methyltransferase 22 isoform X2 [Chlorella sorokiniana]|eukprot:PRW58350.1 methyltransferase 22 isoform X2 [Chlorella sorokiniana]